MLIDVLRHRLEAALIPGVDRADPRGRRGPGAERRGGHGPARAGRGDRDSQHRGREGGLRDDGSAREARSPPRRSRPAFRGWNDVWLDPAFRAWNIEEYLPGIQVPVLAIQGDDDEYGTMDQLNRVARGAPDVEQLRLANCRHSPHKDQPEAVIAAVAAFVRRL